MRSSIACNSRSFLITAYYLDYPALGQVPLDLPMPNHLIFAIQN